MFASTNVIPLGMSSEELTAGTRWLMNRLYSPTGFTERLSSLARQLPAGSASRSLAGREGAELWDRISRGFRELGDGLEDLPRDGAAMFKGKDLSHLATSLIFYFHVVRLLRTWGIWDPELARTAEPLW